MESDKEITSYDKKNSRISYIDIIKGIGILMVIFQHCTSIDEGNLILSSFSRGILTYHMPLFFFASGLVVKDTNSDIFYSKKVKSLLIPVIIFRLANVVIYTLLLLCNKTSWYTTFSFGGFWFLLSLFYIECIYYFVFNVIIQKKEKKNIKIFLSGVLLLGLGLIYSNYILGEEVTIATSLVGYFFFTIGIVVRKMLDLSNQVIRKNIWLKLICFGTGILIIGITTIVSKNNAPIYMFVSSYGNPVLFVIFAVWGIVGIVTLSIAIGENSGPMSRFSTS